MLGETQRCQQRTGGDIVKGAAPPDMAGEHSAAWRSSHVNQVNHGTANIVHPNRIMKKMKRAMRDPVEGDQAEHVELDEKMDLGSSQILKMTEVKVHGGFIFKVGLSYRDTLQWNNPNQHMEM